jgi:hypothetical protein
MTLESVEFDIAVFSTNEAKTIASCVTAIDRACRGHSSRISVLFNGTTDASISIIRSIKLANACLKMFLCRVEDKANTMNQFLYVLRDPTSLTHFFVDGYVAITPGALEALADALATHPDAYMASGVPLNGRSAKAIVDNVRSGRTGVRGNLFAMRPTFADRIVTAQLRLPRGLYRGDGLLGAMAKHNLDPLSRSWDENRVIDVLDATYSFRPLSPFRWKDIQRQYRREIRQARGRMENEAIKAIVYRDGFSGLPADSDDMLVNWLQRCCPPSSRSFRERFFINRAAKKVSISRRVASNAKELIFENLSS